MRYLSISSYGAHEADELVQLLEAKGDLDRAKYYYNRSILVDPFDLDTHTRLAELYQRQELYSSETDERRIILALNPLDRSVAYYNLALSLYNDKRLPNARKEVLRALDLAPGYRDAQKLLLRCVETD